LECFEHFDYIVGAKNVSQVFVAASISRMCGCCRDSLRAFSWLKVLLVATVWLALRQSKQIVVIRGVLPLHR
jgi:uncharacterized membrane protein